MRCGKFFRLLLTKTGKLFFSGQNKKSTAGSKIELNQCIDKFEEITNIYPLAADDEIISCDGGHTNPSHMFLIHSFVCEFSADVTLELKSARQIKKVHREGS